MQGSILENIDIGQFFTPKALTTASTGDWIDVSQHKRFAVVFVKNAGTAGDDPTLTIEQATAAAGSGNKALNFTRLYTKQNTTIAAEAWNELTQTAANTYTDATSAEDQAIWVVEFTFDDLDADNDYKYVQASVGDVGTNAQYGVCLIILMEPRHAVSPADKPILTD